MAKQLNRSSWFLVQDTYFVHTGVQIHPQK